MKVVDNHAHAEIYYHDVTYLNMVVHIYYLFTSMLVFKFKRYSSLTTHLPYNLTEGSNYHIARNFVLFGELLSKLLGIKIYWEYAPALNYGTWTLKNINLDWQNIFKKIPENILLCLDTGHVMLGSATKEDARSVIRLWISKFGRRIRHLHVHENDFISDKHWFPEKVSQTNRILTEEFIKEITEDRSFIYEP